MYFELLKGILSFIIFLVDVNNVIILILSYILINLLLNLSIIFDKGNYLGI